MSRLALEEFSQLVIIEPELQQRLLTTTTRDEFVELVSAVAGEHGFDVARADVEEALVDRRRARLQRWV